MATNDDLTDPQIPQRRSGQDSASSTPSKAETTSAQKPGDASTADAAAAQPSGSKGIRDQLYIVKPAATVPAGDGSPGPEESRPRLAQAEPTVPKPARVEPIDDQSVRLAPDVIAQVPPEAALSDRNQVLTVRTRIRRRPGHPAELVDPPERRKTKYLRVALAMLAAVLLGAFFGTLILRPPPEHDPASPEETLATQEAKPAVPAVIAPEPTLIDSGEAAAQNPLPPPTASASASSAAIAVTPVGSPASPNLEPSPTVVHLPSLEPSHPLAQSPNLESPRQTTKPTKATASAAANTDTGRAHPASSGGVHDSTTRASSVGGNSSKEKPWIDFK